MKTNQSQPTLPTRAAAWELLQRYTQSESLLRHALAVEAVMRHFARRFGEQEEHWGIIGLVHDLDYEQYPHRHCRETERILTEQGWPQEWIRAIMSHGWGICTDVEPRSHLEQTLYTIDELTGLVAATALMRPSHSVLDMAPKSVRKKWNQKNFAAGVNREVIAKGAEMMSMELTEVIAEVIAGMRTVAERIGLQGTVPNAPAE